MESKVSKSQSKPFEKNGLRPAANSEEVRNKLAGMSMKQLEMLSNLSSISMYALLKIKYAQVVNPGINTVAKFWPYIDQAKEQQ